MNEHLNETNPIILLMLSPEQALLYMARILATIEMSDSCEVPFGKP